MITRGIVQFDPAAFIAAYPAFATVPADTLNQNFALACLQLNNELCSVVQDVNIRASLFNLLVAHITALLNGVNGQPPSGTVGRVANVNQGSVSAGLDYTSKSEAAAYYAQTPWGAQFWQSTVVYRTARFIRGPNSPCPADVSWDAWPE